MSLALQRHIIHIDLDSFFVAVECLKDSSLLGKPLLIGGVGDRGVVASCSYEARKFGVHSAMPMKQALKLCPQALTRKGDIQAYSNYSRMVTAVINETVPIFEKSSIDEFYADLTGMEKFMGGSSKLSRELAQKITHETGLPLSYALAGNKLVSKVATNEVKPKGTIEVPFGTEKAYLAPLAVEKLPGVGKETTSALHKMNIRLVKKLAETDIQVLERIFGKQGHSLLRKANGIDESPVVSYHEQKSISTENTFSQDLNDATLLNSQLVRMTEKIAFDLRSQNKLTGCVAVKLRYPDFDTHTRQITIPYTNVDHILIKHVQDLFKALHNPKMPVRLIGIRFTQLITGNYQLHLFDDTEQNVKLYESIDSIKQQFGESFLRRASAG